MISVGCCSWSYHRSLEAKRIHFEDWLRLCSNELRVNGVDIIAEHMPTQTKSYWLDTKKRCTDYQLTVVCLSPSNNFGKPTALQRQREVSRVKRWIDAASILGAPRLRIFAGWPPPGKAKLLWPAMRRCISQVAATAAQAGVTLVVEPHNHGGFLSTSETTLSLIRELDSPWVRINLDTGNYLDRDLYSGLNASLPYTSHVVAKIHRLGPDGEEEGIDYGRVFALLSRHRYRGFVTVEYEGQEDEFRQVAQAIAMIRRHAAASKHWP
ncbi:MAG: sugar phosphate isomerase/epimerase [Candidatus Omnitrophica bacterium]|nr:sugar phosphate isomerase/epimerase [Candidatus Omnitrophota bacterium]